MDALETAWNRQKNEPDLRLFNFSYLLSFIGILSPWILISSIEPFGLIYNTFFIRVGTWSKFNLFPIFSIMMSFIGLLIMIYYRKNRISKIGILLNLVAFISCLLFYFGVVFYGAIE